MKIFENKLLVKLIASLCIFLTLLNFGLTHSVYAVNEEDDDEEFGGVLLTPVMHLLTGIADGIMDILHNAVLGQTETLIKLDGTADTWWSNHGHKVHGWITGLVVLVAIAAGTILSGGVAVVAAGAGLIAKISATVFVIKTVAVAAAAGIASGVTVAKIIDAKHMADDIYLPIFKLTPEQIFANEIWMFDVNFFSPNEYKQKVMLTEEVTFSQETIVTESKTTGETDNNNWTGLRNTTTQIAGIWTNDTTGDNFKSISELNSFDWSKYNGGFYSGSSAPITDIVNKINVKQAEDHIDIIEASAYSIMGKGYIEQTKNAEGSIVTEKQHYILKMKSNVDGGIRFTIKYTCTTVGEENEGIPASLTVIRESGGFTGLHNVETEINKPSTAAELKDVISKWYFTLRNLALVVLMLILIYTGIRIVTGSTAGEKAKYKERIMDWIVAMCLIFVMHYIMYFAVELTEEFIKLIDKIDGTNAITNEIWLVNENHIDFVKENLSEYIVTEEQGGTAIEWGTDLVGGMRIEQQKLNEGTLNWVGYGLCYIVLVIYTLIFTWTYLKRVLYMAFLTMIAPMVAMTYPIDKLTDGKAQAFNAWLKEYIFNLLIQPFHLLLYTVLVGSAFQLAGTNIIYAIVAIGFMTPAEKLLRKFFGFDKAQTPGLLGGAAGAALAMTGLQSLMKHGPKGSGGGKGHGGDDESNGESSNIKWASSDGVSPKGVVARGLGISPSGEDGESIVNGNGIPVTRGFSVPGEVSVPAGMQVPTRKTVPAGMQEPTGKTVLTGMQVPTGRSVPVGKGRVTNSGAGSWSYSPRQSGKRQIKGPAKYSALGAIGAGLGAYNRALGQKNYKRMKNIKPIRSMVRGAAGLFGATAFGMAGLAIGIASGDASKAFQYTTAGAAGGFSFGKGVGGAAIDAVSVDTDKLKDEMEMSYYGEDYKQVKLQEEKSKMQYNEEYINTLRRTLGVSRSQAKDILKNTGSYCFDSGIRGAEDIAAVEKMSKEIYDSQVKAREEEKIANGEDPTLTQKEKEGIWEDSVEHTISMKKFHDRMPNISQMGEKKRGEYQKRFKNEMDAEIRKQLGEEGINHMQYQEMQRLKTVKNEEQKEMEKKIQGDIKKKIDEETSAGTVTDERKKQIEREVRENVIQITAQRNVDKAIAEKADEAAWSIIDGATAYDDAKSGLFEA